MTVPPIQCFTCGKNLGHIYDQYNAKLQQKEESNKILDDLNIKRICCRRMIFTTLYVKN